MPTSLLVDVRVLIGLSIISAFIGFAFNKMLEPGMIFEFYKNWLNHIKHTHPKLMYVCKPAGLCIVCNTTWIGFIISILLGLELFYILIVGISGATIVILLENIFKKLQQ